MKLYKFAFMKESGSFDVVEEFEARHDASANRKAERIARQWPDRDDWYVLDAKGKNINA